MGACNDCQVTKLFCSGVDVEQRERVEHGLPSTVAQVLRDFCRAVLERDLGDDQEEYEELYDVPEDELIKRVFGDQEQAVAQARANQRWGTVQDLVTAQVPTGMSFSFSDKLLAKRGALLVRKV
jgi:hypothetical protein